MGDLERPGFHVDLILRNCQDNGVVRKSLITTTRLEKKAVVEIVALLVQLYIHAYKYLYTRTREIYSYLLTCLTRLLIPRHGFFPQSLLLKYAKPEVAFNFGVYTVSHFFHSVCQREKKKGGFNGTKPAINLALLCFACAKLKSSLWYLFLTQLRDPHMWTVTKEGNKLQI